MHRMYVRFFLITDKIANFISNKALNILSIDNLISKMTTIKAPICFKFQTSFPQFSVEMKAVLLCALIFTISDVFGSPVTSKPSTRTKQKWQMVPDGEGRMHLIDVTAPVEEIERKFNAEADTIFNLHTRENSDGQRITWSLGSIQGSTFNPSHPVRFLIHGWNSDFSSGVNVASTKSYLDMGDYNVIVVDWGAGAGTINYATARNRVPEVADIIAKLIDFLVENGLSRTSNFIIAGHSLGAHIAGLTGKRTKNSSGVIKTIFALDPAGPLFYYENVDDRFDADDAEYTQGIRTNAGYLGFDVPLAHADFYPNW